MAFTPPSPLLRAAVAGVALSGASALVWAGVLAGGVALVLSVADAVLSLTGLVVWEFRQREGYLILAAAGGFAMVGTGLVLLAQGALPWALIAFWGGSAVVLSAILHHIGGVGPERSTMATVVAVISLLALTALGLGEYVRSTWTPSELAVLRALPVYDVGASGSTSSVKTTTPVAGGEWGASWSVVTSEPVSHFARLSERLTAKGWTVNPESPTALLAEKDGFTLELQASVNPEAIRSSSGSSTSTPRLYVMHLIAHVRESQKATLER